VLLNGSLEFHQLLCLCFRIGYIGDGSVGWNGPDSSLYAGVETLFNEKQHDASQGMNIIVVGENG
jgi:hypothetical protein